MPGEAPLNTRTRWLVIVAGGALVAALAWLAPAQREDVALPAKADPSSPIAQDSSRLAALPARDALGEARSDLFGAKSWTPPRVAVKAAPPPAPVPPPNPYKVAGTIVQGGAKRVYLVNGERVYEARQGDELDGGYRVDSIAADQVVLLYAPLAKKEALPIAATLGVDVPIAAAPAPASPMRSVQQDPSRPAQLRWEGPERVRAGSNFTVVLRVTSWQALRATPMQVSYEPKLLEPVGVRAGKFFGEGKFSYRVNPGGSIFVGATGEGAAPGADAELVAVTFKPIKAGVTAEVRLSSLALQGAEGRALAHDQVAAFRTAVQ